jgi:hypothetical protein
MGLVRVLATAQAIGPETAAEAETDTDLVLGRFFATKDVTIDGDK